MRPIPSISQVTTSPRLRKQGGSIPIPTPAGVPVMRMVRELTDDVADIEEHLVRHAVLPQLSVDKASDG